MNKYDAIIIGGGPAGLACALRAHIKGLKVLILEREAALGGILKQCIHDGFGMQRFKEKLTGPEYAERFIKEIRDKNIEYQTSAFVTQIDKTNQGFEIFVVNSRGIEKLLTDKIVLATGCRERTAKQVNIYGSRPKGVYTAGCVQHLVNIEGVMPAKKCVILGSGDIGLIMARRLTLEGAKVLGVYEIMPEPSGLARNISQCLDDFNIPLYLSKTVTKVYGDDNLKAVQICAVDKNLQVIEKTEEIVECDTLIVSVGLIPENELAEKIGVKLDPKAKGAICDLNFETNVDGVFTCGNATHVNDLVDYVSQTGEIVAEALSKNRKERNLININVSGRVSYVVPELIDINTVNNKATMFFRTNKTMNNALATLSVDGKEIYRRKYSTLRPPEMQSFEVDYPSLSSDSKVVFEITEDNK